MKLANKETRNLMQNKDNTIKIIFFYLSCWVFKWSIVLGKSLNPHVLIACIYAKLGCWGISFYFTGIILEKIWTMKTSYLIVKPLKGGVVNRLPFSLICSFEGQVYARVCICCFSLWLGSFPGVSSGNIDGGEGGESEDNCFLPTIHPEQRSLKS